MNEPAGARSRPSAQTFWTWWAAGTTSQIGSAVGAVALPLTALTVLDASPFQLGLVAAAGYVAWIVIGLPAGLIVQRLPLRGLQVGADLARAVAVASVPVAWWWGHLTIAHLVVTALVLSFAGVLFDVANSTFLPSIVSREELEGRNSLTSGTHAVTQLGGPSVGGLLVGALGAVPTLLVDAASYLVSAVLLRSLPVRSVTAPDRWPPVAAMIRQGWGFVVHHRVIGPAMWAATAVNFMSGAQLALYPLYLVHELDAPLGLVGLLLAVDGLGALAGAAVTTRLTARWGSARACLLGAVVAVVGAFMVPWGKGVNAYLAFCLGSLLFAAGTVVLSITTRTYRQIASPPDLLSRVMATVRFVSWGAIPLGGLVAGALAEAAGGRTTLLLFAGATALAPVALFLSPVRHLRHFTDYQPAEPPFADAAHR